MTDVASALQSRHLWWVCRDRIGDEQQIAGESDVAIRPSSRPFYDRLRAALPADDETLYFASPSRRTQQTSARLSPTAAWTSPEALGPRRFGTWDGKTWAEVRVEDPRRCETFWNENAVSRPPGGGESMRDVAERVEAWLTTVLHAERWRNAVVVTHPALVRAALAQVLDLPLKNALRVAVEPLSVTHLSHSWLGWQVHTVNYKP